MRMSHTRKKTLLTGYILDPTFTISKTLQQRNAIPSSVWTKELKAMNLLRQCRDNFQSGGKDELNLKLTFFITAGFFRNLEVLNPGIKSVKNIWNLKQDWITPESLSHFRAVCQVFIKMRS